MSSSKVFYRKIVIKASTLIIMKGKLYYVLTPRPYSIMSAEYVDLLKVHIVREILVMRRIKSVWPIEQ